MTFRPLRCPRCGSQKIEVYQYRCNFSAFNGYHWTRSRYSGVRCLDCGWPWRTLSAFLRNEPDTAKAQRAFAVVSAIANDLDIDRLLIYRRAVEAGYFTDKVPDEPSA